VDPVWGVAYVARPNGTIDAIDLRNGQRFWTTSEAALPLGLVGDVLVAQVDHAGTQLEVAFLGAASGKKRAAATVPLPFGAIASINDGLARQFRAVAEPEDSLVRVSWLSVRGFISGASSDIVIPPVVFVGSALIDPASGNVFRVDSGPVSAVPPRWGQDVALQGPPWRTAGVSWQTEGGRGGPLTLKRTDMATGVPLPDVVLSQHAVEAFPSADVKNVLVIEEQVLKTPDDPFYRWLIFDSDSGQWLAERQSDDTNEPFFVFGDSIIFQAQAYSHVVQGVRVDVPLQIDAMQFTTGLPKWNLEIRDPTYLGPYPSAPSDPSPSTVPGRKRVARH
jgi:hypothetical protein